MGFYMFGVIGPQLESKLHKIKVAFKLKSVVVSLVRILGSHPRDAGSSPGNGNTVFLIFLNQPIDNHTGMS